MAKNPFTFSYVFYDICRLKRNKQNCLKVYCPVLIKIKKIAEISVNTNDYLQTLEITLYHYS